MVSRPTIDQPEYIVEVKPGLNHVHLAGVIARRVSGKVGYIYKYLNGFTIYSFPDSMVARIRQMPEVLSVEKSQSFRID